MASRKLQAKKPGKGKSSGGGISFDSSTILVGIFILALLSAGLWYIWPRPQPSFAESSEQRKLKELTTQHPDAEVFDLGGGEKKN